LGVDTWDQNIDAHYGTDNEIINLLSPSLGYEVDNGIIGLLSPTWG